VHKAVGALFLASLLALFLLTACGGEETGPAQGTPTPAARQTQTPAGTPSAQQTGIATATPKPPGGALDACSLLTKEEVEAALGTSVTEPEREETPQLVFCSFNDPQTPIRTLVLVSIFMGKDADQAREIYRLSKSNAADAQTVGGIGDEAFWDGILTDLQVLKGKYAIEIDVSPDGYDALAVAKELAGKVLSRLP
jgi:hypothetical protein